MNLPWILLIQAIFKTFSMIAKSHSFNPPFFRSPIIALQSYNFPRPTIPDETEGDLINLLYVVQLWHAWKQKRYMC